LQVVALLLVWAHGCLGLHFWLRLKPGYPRYYTAFLVTALLLPAVALSGFAGAAKEAALLARDPQWLNTQLGVIGMPGPEGIAWIYDTADRLRLTALGIIVAVFTLRAVRLRLDQRHG